MKTTQQTFITKALIASVALTLTLTLPANANLLSNGSFESPVTITGWFGIYSSLPGWSSTYSSIELQNQIWPSADGIQHVELDAWANSDVYQTVSTTPGQTYALSFAYSPRPGTAADSSAAELYFNGSLIDSVTGSGIGATTTSWSLHSYYVTATGSSSTVLLAAGGINDGFGGLIDDVQLVAVPEPSAAILVGIGLIGLAKFGRKRFQA